MRRSFAFVTALLLLLGGLVVATASSASATGAGLMSTARATLVTSPDANRNFKTTEFDPTNTTTVSGTATTSSVDIQLGGGTAGLAVGLQFTAPTGSTLEPGTYFGDDPYGVRGLASVSESSLGCQDAQFTVVDIASTGSALTRVDIRYQTTCSSGSFSSNVNATLFGELELGEPDAGATLVTGQRSQSWPDVAVGARSGAQVPLWYRNTGSVAQAVGAFGRTGADPADFPVLSDGCSHTTLAAHTSCQIVLGFQPGASGTRSAIGSLTVGGTTATVQVSGTGTPGSTLLRMTSQAGDFVGGGKSYLINDAQEKMYVARQMPGTFEGDIADLNGITSWDVEVGAPNGVPMTLGTHAANLAGTGGQYGLRVSGEGRGCGSATGSVTIKQISSDADGAPTAFDMTFSQTCTDSTAVGAALTGEIEYHATTGNTGVTAPIVYANDTFARTITGGFGVADQGGGLWSPTGRVSALSVDRQGKISLSPAQTAGAYLSAVSHYGIDLQVAFSLPILPVGGTNGYYLSLIGRRISATEQYLLLVRVAPGGSVFLTLEKSDGATTTTNLSPAVKIGTVGPGQTVHVRFDTAGSSPTTLQAQAWTGSTIPSGWTLSVTDATYALQRAGSPGVSGYLSGATTNGPVTAALSSFEATALGAD